MIESEADQFRDPAAVARCARVAARVFERHNVDFLTAQREGGWSNATWSAGGLVLRVAVATGTEHLRREAWLAAFLPPEVGYPPVVETGVTTGLEWMLTKRIAGRNLDDAWPTLDWEVRAAAIDQLWGRIQAIHSVDPDQIAARVPHESRFYAPDPEQAAQQLARLGRRNVLTCDQVAVLSTVLDHFWPALRGAPRVLNHGDLCRENALWHDGRVVGLLDLEYALLAPVELDLNELVRIAYGPPETPDPLPDPDGSGLERLRQTVGDIVVSTVSPTGGADRLFGFSLLLDMWVMEEYLSEWDGTEPYTDWACYQALTSLADGRGGYLAPVLARLGPP